MQYECEHIRHENWKSRWKYSKSVEDYGEEDWSYRRISNIILMVESDIFPYI